jgi:hypothetical protein
MNTLINDIDKFVIYLNGKMKECWRSGICGNRKSNMQTLKGPLMMPELVTRIQTTKHLKLAGCDIPPGTYLDTIKVNADTYKVFHHTGWWAVPIEYFETEV